MWHWYVSQASWGEVCQKFKVVRWGGEEFLIALMNVTEEEAFGLSETIRRKVEQYTFFHDSVEFSCTITLGLHCYSEEEGIELNIKYADQALYYGKRHGKNCSVWYEEIE